MNQLYQSLPNFLKNIAVSLAAFAKNRKKYGQYYEHYLSYILNSTIEEQQKLADSELEQFLTKIRNRNTFYNIPEDLDISRMPIIEKGTVVKNYHNILNGKPYATVKSSGTTGQPLPVPYNIRCYQKEYAFWWYQRSYEGIKRGNRIATFAGHKITHIDRNTPPFWVMNYADNQILFSSYHFTQANLKYYINQLNKFKPIFIHGYPSSIYLVAKYILTNNIQLEFQPKMIVTGSETTLDFQKKAIEEAFGCKSYIWYGNTELCGHITECPNGKLHVQPYHSLVRIVNEGGQDVTAGEEGFLVGTNFANTTFPLINYNTKDVVKLSENQNCSCDKGGTIVDYIVGRVEDYVVTPDGRHIGRLDHLFKDAKHVRNAQLEQRTLDELIIRIEKEDRYNEEIEEIIFREARNRLGEGMNIVFEYVAEIPKKGNGKFDFIIQNLDVKKLNHIIA